MDIGLLLISSLANIGLAFLVYAKNPRQIMNRAFAGAVLSLVGVALMTFLSLHVHSPLPYIRLTMVFALMLVTTFKWFSLGFPQVSYQFSRFRKFEMLAALIVGLIMFSPLTFNGVSVDHDGNVQPHFGFGIAAFMFFFVYMVGSGMLVLARNYIRATGKERSQLQYVIFATSFLFGAEFLSSLLLPLLFKVSIGVALSPLYFAVFAGIITIAIVKRQLFDIRAVAARSLAYLLLLATLAGLYAAGLYVLTSLFFKSDRVSIQYQIVNLVLAITVAYTFPIFKRFFDHLTQRIFYRQAYDSASVIKELTDMLVSTTSPEAIMRQSLSILGDAIGISRVQLLVIDGDKPYRVKAHGGAPNRNYDVSKLRRSMDKAISAAISVDPESRDLLAELETEVIVRLKTPDATIGYLLADAKRSGVGYTHQDLELLQIACKEIAVAIHNALFYEKMEHFNQTLQDRVQKATKELQRTNDKLRDLDTTKDEFISMASHQLRTPLTSVKGYLSMVLEGDVGKLNKQQTEMLTQSYISAQRMVYLISDLLNLSRLNTGKFVIELTPVDLSQIVQLEIDQLRETAKSRGVNLRFDPPEKLSRLMLDETKIHQVVMNLIDNAIYYTPSGGEVVISLRETASAVEFRVVDNGIGVPKEVQHKLFTKFYRAQNAQAARPDGTGLGLFMAKKVIVAQGGAIIFESEEGKGSTFGFRFARAHHVAPTVGRPAPQAVQA